ncbi:putative transcriptional regulator [Acinetobacter phage BS46]|nr:putative transcriptional regulator [Acinetobacter phage BS46]
MTDLKTIEQNENKTFDEIIAKPEGRKQFVEAIHNLARQKVSVQRSQEILKDDVSVVADAFKLSKTEVNKLVEAQLKDDIEGSVEKLESLIDKYQILLDEQ